MKLTIRFSGLFLYAPHKTEEQLFVVAPETGYQAPVPAAPHVMRLQIFDAYEQGRGMPVSGRFRWLELGHRSLEIGDGKTPSAKRESLSDHLADLRHVTASEPRGELFEAAPGAKAPFHGRVIVSSGHQCGETLGAQFRFRGPKRLATEIFWQIDMPDEPLTLRTVDLDGSTKDTVTLSTDQDEMCIGVFHVPSDDLPHHDNHVHPHARMQLGHGHPTPHFLGLYTLYADPEDALVPILDTELPAARTGCDWCGRLVDRGGDPITCAGARN